jgi:hypothetical protein
VLTILPGSLPGSRPSPAVPWMRMSVGLDAGRLLGLAVRGVVGKAVLGDVGVREGGMVSDGGKLTVG